MFGKIKIGKKELMLLGIALTLLIAVIFLAVYSVGFLADKIGFSLNPGAPKSSGVSQFNVDGLKDFKLIQ